MMMARARHAAVCLVLAVLTTTNVVPRVGAFTGGLRAAVTQQLRPHDCSMAAASSTVVSRRSPRNSNAAAAGVPSSTRRRLASPSALPMAPMDFPGAGAGAGSPERDPRELDPALEGNAGDTYVKCGKCQACYAVKVEVLGRGRIIECSVCGNKWFQTAERALTLTENFLMKDWTENRAKDAAEAAKRVASFELFVGNIPLSVSEKDLGAIFGNFGDVKSATLVTDANGDSKGYGNVRMTSAEDGQKAIKALNGIEIQGKSMLVKVGASNASGAGGGGGRGRSFQGRGGGGRGGYAAGRGGGGF
ncbi:unnamed protein product [Pylaiella littoralis]